MTKTEFNEVLRASVTKEFKDIPKESEIDYEFSEKFLRKMDKLIGKTKRREQHKSSFKAKNVIALVAAILLMLVGLMSVSAVREPVVSFVVKVCEGFNEIFFSGDTTKEIGHVYSFTNIPEGFGETERITSDVMRFVSYKNDKTGDLIELSQSITERTSFALDNENGEVKSLSVDGKEIKIYRTESRNICYAFWIEDECAIELVYSGEINDNELKNLIRKIA